MQRDHGGQYTIVHSTLSRSSNHQGDVLGAHDDAIRPSPKTAASTALRITASLQELPGLGCGERGLCRRFLLPIEAQLRHGWGVVDREQDRVAR